VISVRDPIESRLEVSLNPLPVDGIPGQMLSSLRGADPSGGGDPTIALLSDGRGAAPWRGHRELGRRLGIPVVAQEQLYASRGRIRAWVGDRSREIRVLYRRTAEEKLSGRSGALTALGGLLIGPLRAGTISCVNAFGAGLADDKAVHAYSDNLIRFYLGEEPLVPAIRAYDLGAGDQLSEALQRLDELVVKGRGGSGGEEVVIAEGLASDGLRTVAAEIQRAPCAYIAQEKVTLSTHPAIADGAMAPRHVDLRPFALLTNGSVTVAPGAFTRFATKPGEMIVNATRGGGGKDTWILPAEDVVPAEPQR
jgi:uncharacterized circularly permuted ATP-grasp superfamily protein